MVRLTHPTSTHVQQVAFADVDRVVHLGLAFCVRAAERSAAGLRLQIRMMTHRRNSCAV